MSWSSVIGQDRVKKILRQILRNKQIAHAYLFYGAEGVGKDALVLEFAKTLNCSKRGEEACNECDNCKRSNLLQHPNIKLVFALPVGKNEKTGDGPLVVLTESQVMEVRDQLQIKMKNPYHRIEISKANFIKINSVREIKRDAAMSRAEEGKKIFVIFNAEMMNSEASNSLLKTLEEPLADTILLLTTSSKDKLLPTIISRCQLIKCDLLQENEIENALVIRDNLDPITAHRTAQIANGSYGYARLLSAQDMAGKSENVVEFMRLVLGRNKVNLLDKIDELASSFDKISIQQWLKFLQSWLRNVLIINQNIKIPLMDEEKQDMENFINKFSHANLVAAINDVDRAIAHIDKNIYLHLILTNLAIDLRKDITENIRI